MPAARKPTRLSGRNERRQTQQGRFRAAGMMNHHPHALCRYSVASLVTGQVGHFWKADPDQFSKAPKSYVACASSISAESDAEEFPATPSLTSRSESRDRKVSNSGGAPE